MPVRFTGSDIQDPVDSGLNSCDGRGIDALLIVEGRPMGRSFGDL